jgi:hypothetical protein
MKRRDFLRTLVGVVFSGVFAPEVLAKTAAFNYVSKPEDMDDHIKDYLHKMRQFDKPHEKDFYLEPDQFRILVSCLRRLKRVQRTVGHGNFYLISFDYALKMARHYSRIGRFTKAELEFMEMIFHEDASHYGFLGEKPLHNLTASVKGRDIVKVPYTGNYLFKDVSLEIYEKVRKQVGEQAILTSGVRNVMKQFLLFLNKAYKCKGNLSLASRSLAPPGYSFHGIGDFDVGQAGFGVANFTERFTDTEVYRRLRELGYVTFRYPPDNLLGVRFEPWHIKVSVT